MRIVTVTTLFPNRHRPEWGVFVETRLRHLLASGSVEGRVVCPVPWLKRDPRSRGILSSRGLPEREERRGIQVFHPRYPSIPVLGRWVTPLFIALAAARGLRRLRREGFDFDLIDGHFLYPDGVAAVLLGIAFRRPVVVTARGTDANWTPRRWIPRRMIRWTAARAVRVVTVSGSLKAELERIGVPAAQLIVLRNGVDGEHFRPPADRGGLRRHLGLTRPTLLCSGQLIERKGVDRVIRALPCLPDVDLVLVGDGPLRTRLTRLAAELGVAERVRFLGVLSQDALVDWYGAVDALVLASSREGYANVLLESIACGTPVIASDTGAAAELLGNPSAGDPSVGRLLQARTPEAIAAAVIDLLAEPPARSQVRARALALSWSETTRGQVELFGAVVPA